ncbi:MAG: hypothetical protein K6T65_03340 [Peptococcaceae bacterium]|nr:hypothetical protein [Peptococcaceae bacterium]
MLIAVTIAALTLFSAGILWILGLFHTGPELVGLADSVDISPDDGQIVFPYYQGGVASLYTANADGTGVRLLAGIKDTSLLRPRYSPDGTKILFLAAPKKKENRRQTLYIMDRDGRNQKRLLPEDILVTEAIFSPDGRIIYFLKAGTFRNYSPIASRRPHEFDIFSIDIDGNNLKRLTHKEEYDMSGLSVTSDGQRLLYLKYKKGEQPLYIISADGNEDFLEILPKGRFRHPEVFYAALSPDDRTVAFSAISDESDRFFEYELFLMDFKTLETKQLTNLKTHVSEPVFFHKQDKIMFVHYINWPEKPPQYQICSIDLDGKYLKNIDLVIPEER